MNKARIQLVTETDIFISDEFELPAKDTERSFEYNCKVRERFMQKKKLQFRTQHLKFIIRAKNWHIEYLILQVDVNYYELEGVGEYLPF